MQTEHYKLCPRCRQPVHEVAPYCPWCARRFRKDRQQGVKFLQFFLYCIGGPFCFIAGWLLLSLLGLIPPTLRGW